MTSTTPTNRDFSELSALLAKVASSSAASTKPKKQAPLPANNNRAPDVLAWPTFERLAYRGDETRVYALRHWRNLCFPGAGYIPPEPADDTDEAQVEVRPSEAELLRAAGWSVTGRERWGHTGKSVNTYEPAELTPSTSRNRNGGSDTVLGHLRFRDGALIEWGRTKKDRPLRPVERARGIKGAATGERSEAAIRGYLQILPGAASPFASASLRRPFSGERVISDMYQPLPREEPSPRDRSGRFGVEEARSVLRDHGVDGSVPFERLPGPASRCPDGVVSGPQWVGGVKKPKPLGEISTAAGREPEFARVIERANYLEYLRERLGDHAKVLDMAIGDASAKEIGVAMGKAPAYAEKAGPILIDSAIDALIAIDDTARLGAEEKIAA